MKSLWSDEEARGKDDLALRVYTSRLIGAEPNLVMWGGGNTSVKTKETDHRGRPVDVLRVKGSGSDLKTIEPKHLARRMDDAAPSRATVAEEWSPTLRP
jgi:rhamnose utilization protein RhaD (predicted bifunctional aldolase and dehydrogenase)